VGGSLSREELYAVLGRSGWPEALWAEAASVAFCESGKHDSGTAWWYPDAIGDYGVSRGLFQIGVARPGWQGWFNYFGVDERSWSDPHTNAATALLIFGYNVERHGGDGWFAWSCKPR